MPENLFKISSNIEAFIFDLDGTLVDSMPYHYMAWKNACDYYHLEFPAEKMKEYPGLSTYEIAENILTYFNPGRDTPTAKTLSAKKFESFDHLLHLVKPIDPVIDIVTSYVGKIPMAIGTGGARKTALKMLTHLKLKKYFSVVVAAEDVTHHKPEPDTFLKCAELLHVDACNSLVFEDGDRGIEAAGRAGMAVIDVRKYL